MPSRRVVYTAFLGLVLLTGSIIVQGNYFLAQRSQGSRPTQAQVRPSLQRLREEYAASDRGAAGGEEAGGDQADGSGSGSGGGGGGASSSAGSVEDDAGGGGGGGGSDGAGSSQAQTQAGGGGSAKKAQLGKSLLGSDGVVPDPETFLPTVPAQGRVAASTASCMQTGMQKKCHFTNLIVRGNEFALLDPKGSFPNPIYPADGATKPLKQYHKYQGHKIRVLPASTPPEKVCTRVVRRPTVFLFRMSGHSPYHLWENNLGPFHRTLQEFKGLRAELNDVSRLMVAFVDLKPVSGPKAPLLLDTLLQSFSDLPLVNASRLTEATCFENAVVGVAANHFDHKPLLQAMWRHLAGRVPGPLPAVPKVVFISRNHKTVLRGRKIYNEAEVVKAVDAIVKQRTGRSLEYLHMQDYSYPEQVNMTIDTQIIIGPHGAGIANCIWMQQGAVTLEFAAPAGKTLFNLYHDMCKRSKVSHLSFVAEPDPDDLKLPDSAFKGNKRLFSNMLIPVERMEKHVNLALDRYEENYRKSRKKD